MKVGILILTFNEIIGMRQIMPQIQKDWYDELLIVDGGSTDGTIEYAKAQGYNIFVQSKPGLGAAYCEALPKMKSDIVITLSPDGNSDVSRIPDLIDKIKSGYDLVIVSRYLDWAKSEDDDRITTLGNWFFTKFFNFLFRTSVTDMLVLYRAFRRELFEELQVKTQLIPWQTQLLCRVAKAKLKIGEVPGNEPARIGDERKMQPIRNGLYELCMIFKERFCGIPS